MRTVLCVVALLVLIASPAVAADEAKDLIVGKWTPKMPEKPDVKATIEFTKDGKILVAINEIKIEGTYKFTDKENVEVDLKFMGESKKDKMKVKVTKDELTTTDSNNKTETFLRAK